MDIQELQDHNYVPYSKQPSLAAVRGKSERWYPGVRIENISYPLSISATQNALFCCLSEADRPAELYTEEQESSMIPSWEKEFKLTAKPFDADTLADVTFADVGFSSSINIKKVLADLLEQAVVGESEFPVSALIETENGYFAGVNVECTAWNMGLCAERVAIAKAISYGAQKINGLEISTKKGEFSSPCGACRQVITEHMPKKQVHLHHADGSESVHFSEDLLPHSFSSSSLSNR